MTSANVINYRIYKKGGNPSETFIFRKNQMCQLPDYSDLLKYLPLEDYTIQAYWEDEEEEYWEEKPMKLKKFLKAMIPFNSKIRNYFYAAEPLY